MGGARSMHGR